MGSSEEAHPAVLPGVLDAPDLFAALYGELVPHPWRHPDTDVDVDWLFRTRSLAMQWLSDAGLRATAGIPDPTGRLDVGLEGQQVTGAGAAGLWDLRDAGQQAQSASRPSPVLWAHAGVDPVPAARPLPVQPFLCCAGEVASRIGSLRLDAVQVLLPVQHLPGVTGPNDATPSLDTATWFGECDPDAKTPLQVTLDGGRHRSIRSAAPQILNWLQNVEQDVFICDSYSLTDHDQLALRPPFFDGLWREPAQHRATYRGTIVEWSLDALGWLAGFLADACARHGISTQLLLTAGRID